MHIALVSNFEGIGLQRDAELIEAFLKELGHTVVGYQYDVPLGPPVTGFVEKYDLSIFMEVAPRALMELSERRWIFVNPEWMDEEKIKVVDRNFQKVFAKTREAQRLLEPLFPTRVHYTGFMARDQYDPSVLKHPTFLHIGGNSSLRGTKAVLDAWKWRKNGKSLDAELIVISRTVKGEDLSQRVTHYEKADENVLRILQNRCMFHLYPSETEGFGHAIREGQSCGAVVLATDAPPLDELYECYGLPATKNGKYGLADLYQVSAIDIYDAVNNALNWAKADTLKTAVKPREYFLACNQKFKEVFAPHLDFPLSVPVQIKPTRTKSQKKCITFLGNFEVQESTENQILWALEQRMGYDVEKLNERLIDFKLLREAAEWNEAFIWVKTPGFLQASNAEMFELLSELEKRDIPSIGIHLDRFWGLPERETQIGVHPFFSCKYVWTADGGSQAKFHERNVNHFWMKPAVSEVYCHPGTPREQYKCDVCFVGARSYHKEYPFREQMVSFLEAEYGSRFKHIEGVRGHELNDVYASAKVIVGDCIFAGIPRYWSDRVPETVGRYGTLLHPLVEGMDIPTFFYEPQDLESLRDQIETVLSIDNEMLRSMTGDAAKKVRHRHTWTQRMREILTEAGL